MLLIQSTYFENFNEITIQRKMKNVTIEMRHSIVNKQINAWEKNF